MITQPMEPQHYRDVCFTCSRRTSSQALTAAFKEPVTLACDPHSVVEMISGSLLWSYRCPMDHNWTCYYAVTLGYFSDCMCAYCVQCREEDGAKTWPRASAYNDPDGALYKRVMKAKNRVPNP